MKPEWEPAVEYGPKGWTPMIQRKRWWGMEKRYVQWWGFDKSYSFYVSKDVANGYQYKSDAITHARNASVYANDQEARSRREIFEVD